MRKGSIAWFDVVGCINTEVAEARRKEMQDNNLSGTVIGAAIEVPLYVQYK